MPETPGRFTPDNEPEANRWFWRDLGAMAQSMFQGEAVRLAPFFLEAERSEVPGGWPEGGQTRLDIPNNHLQYAITWFLLAACLLVIYGAYVWKARRGGSS
jgi:surfeit locus 1 family protein